MSDRRLVVFRSRLRPDIDAAYGARAEQIFARAEKARGYIAIASRVFHG